MNESIGLATTEVREKELAVSIAVVGTDSVSDAVEHVAGKLFLEDVDDQVTICIKHPRADEVEKLIRLREECDRLEELRDGNELREFCEQMGAIARGENSSYHILRDMCRGLLGEFAEEFEATARSELQKIEDNRSEYEGALNLDPVLEELQSFVIMHSTELRVRLIKELGSEDTSPFLATELNTLLIRLRSTLEQKIPKTYERIGRLNGDIDRLEDEIRGLRSSLPPELADMDEPPCFPICVEEFEDACAGHGALQDNSLAVEDVEAAQAAFEALEESELAPEQVQEAAAARTALRRHDLRVEEVQKACTAMVALRQHNLQVEDVLAARDAIVALREHNLKVWELAPAKGALETQQKSGLSPRDMEWAAACVDAIENRFHVKRKDGRDGQSIFLGVRATLLNPNSKEVRRRKARSKAKGTGKRKNVTRKMATRRRVAS